MGERPRTAGNFAPNRRTRAGPRSRPGRSRFSRKLQAFSGASSAAPGRDGEGLLGARVGARLATASLAAELAAAAAASRSASPLPTDSAPARVLPTGPRTSGPMLPGGPTTESLTRRGRAVRPPPRARRTIARAARWSTISSTLRRVRRVAISLLLTVIVLPASIGWLKAPVEARGRVVAERPRQAAAVCAPATPLIALEAVRLAIGRSERGGPVEDLLDHVRRRSAPTGTEERPLVVAAAAVGRPQFERQSSDAHGVASDAGPSSPLNGCGAGAVPGRR